MNCTDDFDCPVAFSCDVDKTCTCNIWFNWQGEKCTEPGAATWFIFSFASLYALAGFGLFLLISKQLMAVTRAVGKHKIGHLFKRRNTVILAHALNALAFASFALWHVFYFLEAAEPETSTLAARLAGPEIIRTSTWAVVTRFFIVSTQVCATLATLHLSIAWVEVGYRVDTFSKEKLRKMQRALSLLEILFVLTMCAISLTGQLELAAAVIIPFILVLVALILIGRSRLVKLLAQAVAMVDPSDVENGSAFNSQASTKPVPDNNEFADDPFSRKRKLQGSQARQAIQQIRTCSFHIALSLILIVISGTLFSLMTWVPENSWKGLRTPSGASVVTYTVNLIPLALLYLLCSIFWYTRASVQKIIESSVEGSANPGTATDFQTRDYFGYQNSSVGHVTETNFQSHLEALD